MQRRHPLEVADDVTGKLHGKGLGLASGEVDENAGDVGRLALQIDAGDDVRLIFWGCELRGLGVRGLIRKRIDRCTSGIAVPARQ